MKSRSDAAPASAPRVLIASTAMLAFITFWQAAAVVLNDMGSSAFYAGAIAEHFIGKTAPGFVSGRLNERDSRLFPFDHPVSGQRDRGILRHIVHTLFLVGKHQRNSRIQCEGAPDHVCDYRDGRLTG